MEQCIPYVSADNAISHQPRNRILIESDEICGQLANAQAILK
jgi:hypothetical protein